MCVGCGSRRRFRQSRHVQCAHRERRVECERGKNRINRTRRRGQYSLGKRLSSSLLLLHTYVTAYHCPSLSLPHATTNPIVFALWPTPSSTIVRGLLPKTPILSALRVKYLLFILPGERRPTVLTSQKSFSRVFLFSRKVSTTNRRPCASERESEKTNFLRRRPSVLRASSSLTTWVQKCGFSRWNNAVVACHGSNLRGPKNRVIYFLRTAGHNLTEESIPASTERCGLDGFRVISVRQLTAVLNTLTYTWPSLYLRGAQNREQTIRQKSSFESKRFLRSAKRRVAVAEGSCPWRGVDKGASRRPSVGVKSTRLLRKTPPPPRRV